MFHIPNYKALEKLPTKHLKDGESACCDDTGKYYKFDIMNQVWVDSGLQLTLYDMNKQIIAQQPSMSDSDIQREIINNFRGLNPGKYYMLLCNDIKYFTLFCYDKDADEPFENLMLECISNVGTIHDISLTNDSTALEIWVNLPNDDLVAMYLFNYDAGVVYYG